MTRAEFRKIRLSLGLTQEQLARSMGVQLNTVSRWETGALKLPKIAVLAIKQLRAQATGSPDRRSRG